MGQLTQAKYTEIFTRLGKYVKAMNSYLTLQATLRGDYASIAGAYDLTERAITGISKAAAAVVTSAAHPFVTGDPVYFLGVVGMTEINGLTGTITSTTVDTFTVAIASSGFTTYTGGGTATLVGITARRDLIDGLWGTYGGITGGAQGWISTLKSYTDLTLADLQAALNATANDPVTIMSLLLLDMADTTAPRSAAQYVNASVVATPTIATVDTPTGNGTILCSTSLDGTVTDERAINETVLARCTSDVSTGQTAGNELFTLTGWPLTGFADGVTPRGSGNGPTIQVASANGETVAGPNILPYGDFETWAGSPLAPTGWDVTGTAGTHVVKETSVFYTGATACKLVSDTSEDPIGVSISTANFTAMLELDTMYVLSVYVRKKAATAGGGFVVQVVATGGNHVAFSANPNTLNETYTNYKVFFKTPTVWPASYSMEFAWVGAAATTAGDTIYIDEVTIQPATNFGYTWYAAVRGSTDFARDDMFRVTTANDYGGVFQTFFGRFYGALLPSKSDASETISDTLAT